MEYELKQRFRSALQEQIASQISLAGTDDETVKLLIRNTVREATALSEDISPEEQAFTQAAIDQREQLGYGRLAGRSGMGRKGG